MLTLGRWQLLSCCCRSCASLCGIWWVISMTLSRAVTLCRTPTFILLTSTCCIVFTSLCHRSASLFFYLLIAFCLEFLSVQDICLMACSLTEYSDRRSLGNCHSQCALCFRLLNHDDRLVGETLYLVAWMCILTDNGSVRGIQLFACSKSCWEVQ